ncbi:hypothetical protein GA076_19045 [Vibrio parahaemolyticus]|nr:hypothetical protein [Vibrio parahaemolyticus]EGU9030358.1 hypothetical protein [Vibrio parahaemolyticus]
MLHLYCRVSTTKQLEGLSMSIQGDDTLIEALAQKYNTQIGPRVYQDEGKSAYKGMNLAGELGEFLQDIEAGKVQPGDILVVRALDRISRLGLTKALNVYGQIMEYGVMIHTTMDDRLYKPNDQLSQILATLAFNTANEESEKKSYLTNKYALTRIEQFLTGKRSPDGFSYDIGVGKHPWYIKLEDKAVIPHIEKFKLARELVDLALDGKGISSCRNYAKEHGLELSHSGMARFFKTDALYGKLVVRLEDKEATRKHPNREKQYLTRELDGYYPAVCSKAEFLRIQKIKQLHVDTIAPRKNVISMLAGAKRLYCPNGYSMIASVKNSLPFYRCGFMDCKCSTYVPQYSLNRMILETLQHHVFIPQVEDNHLLLDLEIELEQKTNEFKQRQRMVLENPDLFDSEAMMKLAEDKAEIEAISSKLDAERENQASVLSYAGGLTLEHHQEWLQQTIEYLEATDEETIQSVRERLKSVVRRIELDNGLVRVHLADGSCTVLYMPRWKDARKRSYLKLHVVNDLEKQGAVSLNPAMAFVCFTEQDLKAGLHVFPAEDYPAGLLKPCSKPILKIDHKAVFLAKIREIEAVQWKRKPVMDAGVRDYQWQEFKDLNLTAEGFFVYDVEWKTKSYTKRTGQVVSVNELTEVDLKELLASPKIDSFKHVRFEPDNMIQSAELALDV